MDINQLKSCLKFIYLYRRPTLSYKWVLIYFMHCTFLIYSRILLKRTIKCHKMLHWFMPHDPGSLGNSKYKMMSSIIDPTSNIKALFTTYSPTCLQKLSHHFFNVLMLYLYPPLLKSDLYFGRKVSSCYSMCITTTPIFQARIPDLNNCIHMHMDTV